MSPRRSAPSDDPKLDGVHEGNGVGRERVSEIQRARMLTAMVEVTAECGVGGVTVAHVVARAGVSRRTFYENFEDRDDCLLAAFDDAVERVGAVVIAAHEQQHGWREKVRAGLTALLEFLDGDPATGRLLIVEVLGAGSRALERRREVLAQVVAVVDEGRGEAKKDDVLFALTADGVVGAALSILHARMLEDHTASLVELVNPLMSTIVLPYLGRAAARRELERPIVRSREGSPTSMSSNPLRDLQMRLTYRTVRVLMAAAANPGSSNRAIADGADIADQGQISKLLARLQGLGLIENANVGSGRGEPNAWLLTAKGWEVHAVVRSQAGEHAAIGPQASLPR